MIKDTTFALVSRGLTLVFAFLITLVIARSLGPTLKGAYDIALLVIQVSSMMVVFGLGTANVMLGVREPGKLPIFAGNSIAAAFAFGFITTLILELILFIPAVQGYLLKNGISITWMRWLVGLIPTTLLYTYLQEIMRVAGHIFIFSALNVMLYSLQLLCLSALIFFPNHRLESAILAWVFTQIFMAILTLAITLHITKFNLMLDGQVFKQSLSFGMKLHIGNVAQFLNYRLDIFMVGIFLAPDAVAFYATATLLAERLWDIPVAIRTALTYHISARPDAAATLTAQTCRMIVFITAPIYIGVLLFATPVINIMLGDAFLPSVQPLLWLLPGVWILSIGKMLAIYLASSERPLVPTWAAITSLLFTVLFDIVLIPRIGMSGAAIASSVAYTVATIIIGYIFIKDTKISVSQLIIPQKEDLQSLKQLAVKVLNKMKKKHAPLST